VQRLRKKRFSSKGKGDPSDLRRFLPTCQSDLEQRGIDELDILIISGDAYVDHPAFGPVLIARFLESRGYRVGFVAQPDWKSAEDIVRLGRPRLFVGVSAGNLDSMLNKLTAQKKMRSEDRYSPGGRPNRRPNRASIVYANLCRQAFDGVPILLGGIEASLRRLAHYDYWSDSVRRSILLDAKADLLLFGMAERAVEEVARRLAAGQNIKDITDVRGTAYVVHNRKQWQPLVDEASVRVSDGKTVVLPSLEEIAADRALFAKASRMANGETNSANARPLLQLHGRQAVYLNPPAHPLKRTEMDALYNLPFQYRPHPGYRENIPAFETVKRSIVALRGCFGGCSFCSITHHEGRVIQNRSTVSIRYEAERMAAARPGGQVIDDIGGPTANMYALNCRDPKLQGKCRRTSCLFPRICPNLNTDHSAFLDMLKTVRKIDGIKHLFIASGIRHDLAEKSPDFIEALAKNYTSGMISVAPEHCVPAVLEKMRKPSIKSFERFCAAFDRASHKAGKEQYVIPYFMVGHPGTTLASTIELACYLKRRGIRPRQIQEFIPTPMSMATAMYYSGIDPYTMKPVSICRDQREKRMMKALLFYWDEAHWPLAREALKTAGRHDLIGTSPGCLVPPLRHDDFSEDIYATSKSVNRKKIKHQHYQNRYKSDNIRRRRTPRNR